MLVDIGNTFIKVKINNKHKIFKTKGDKNILLKFLKTNKKTIYISSVVKEYNSFLKQNLNTYFFTSKNKFSFKFNLVGMGIDRLLADEGALLKYKAPLMVVDAGSAITIDYIDADYRLKGGLILPGLNLSAKALNSYASLLPLVKLNKFKKKANKIKLLSSNTEDAIFYGIISPIITLIEHFYKTYNKGNLKIVLTGGDKDLIYKYINLKKRVYLEKDLIFSGMTNLVKKEGL